MVCHQCVFISCFVHPICSIPFIIFYHGPTRNECLIIKIRKPVHIACLTHNFSIFLCVKKIRLSVYILPSNITIITYLWLTLMSLLGSYKDNAISSTTSINGSRSSILEYVNRFYITWIERIDIAARNTINDIKRFRRSCSTQSANGHFKTFTRHARTGNNINTW